MPKTRDRRKNVYFSEEAESSLRLLADRYHAGNQSAALEAAVESYIERGALLDQLMPQAITAYWRALENDGSYDPADDDRVEAPHAALESLVGPQVARALGLALRQLRAEVDGYA